MNRLFDLTASGSHLVDLAEKIADEVSALHADDVDRVGRFPVESIDALRTNGLLGAYVPTEFGGLGASMTDIAAMCHALGQRCSSSAMVFAMHQIQAACLVHHGQNSPGLRESLRRVASEQLLLASATTELGVGGDVRTSLCAVDTGSNRFSITKEASVISYADSADAILVTARRSVDAASSDQVILFANMADSKLTPLSTWDTLGMRGTCSVGYILEAQGSTDQIIPIPYADVSSQTMLPVSHIVWASLWLGIATDAVTRTRAYVRSIARKTPDQIPAASSAAARLFGDLEMVRNTVTQAVSLYESVLNAEPESHQQGELSTGDMLRLSLLKTSVSSAVKRIITDALEVCGIAGFRNDTPYSLGRHLRDAQSAAIMVHNERILANMGRVLCVYKGD
jgi:acyl-CoA dehydrogenase